MLAENPKTDRSTSFILPHEEEEARAFVVAQFQQHEQFKGLDVAEILPRPTGYYVAVKVYIRPEEASTVTTADGKTVTLWRPHTSLVGDKYQSVCGLVVGTGPDAYSGTNADGSPRFSKPWCKIGDWVTFPRHEAMIFSYRKVPMLAIPDDKIIMVIDDPTAVEPIHVADKV